MGSSAGASAGLGRKSAVVGAALVGAPGSRKAGEKVHLCVHCDLPIAIYGLLVPCQHVFCLACATALGKTCARCPVPIQSVEAVRAGAGVLICGIPACLRSFPSKPELLLHVHEAHQDLFQPAAPPPAPPASTAAPPGPAPQHRPFPSPSGLDAPPFFHGPAPGGRPPGLLHGPRGPYLGPRPGQALPPDAFRSGR